MERMKKRLLPLLLVTALVLGMLPASILAEGVLPDGTADITPPTETSQETGQQDEETEMEALPSENAAESPDGEGSESEKPPSEDVSGLTDSGAGGAEKEPAAQPDDASDLLKMAAEKIEAAEESESVSENGFTVSKDGRLISYTGNETEVVIPSEVGGVTVTSISNTAFYSASAEAKNGIGEITGISIPNTVSEIEDGTAAEGAFQGCSKLETVSFRVGGSQHLYVGAYAFYNIDTLQSAVLPSDRETALGEGVFYGCKALSAVNFEQSKVTEIGVTCFLGCKSLTEVTFPGSLTAVSDNAKSEKFGSFYDSGLTKVEFADEGQGALTIGDFAFYKIKTLQSLTLPRDRETIIKAGAFFDCTKLSEVNFEQSKITSIGSKSFRGCSSLREITFPNSMTIVSEGAKSEMQGSFYNSGITKIAFAEGGCGTLTIGVDAFSRSTSLTEVTLPKDRDVVLSYKSFLYTPITEIDLTSVVDMSSATNVFQGCKSLKKVILGDQITVLAQYAFEQCKALSEINLEHIETIGSRVFVSCEALQTISLPNVVSIGDFAFNNCTGLKSISENNVLSQIQSIGKQSFANTGMTEITVENKEAAVALNAFSGSSPITVYGWIGSSVQACGTYENVTFRPLDSGTEGSFVIDKEKGRILAYTGSSLDVVIPAQIDGIPVKSIAGYAFVMDKDVRMITIEAPLMEIEAYTFNGLGQIVSVILPDTVTAIGEHAFSGTGLQTILIPENVLTIGDYAFEGCKSLKNLTLGKELQTVGKYAFSDCTLLDQIELPDSVTKIGDDAFQNTAVKTFRLPPKVEAIPTGMLEGASLLEEFSFAGEPKEIGISAFENCTSLKEFIVPESVTLLNFGAFSGAEALEALVVPKTTELKGSNVVKNQDPAKLYLYVEQGSPADLDLKAFPEKYCTRQYPDVPITAALSGSESAERNLDVSRGAAEAYHYSDLVKDYQASVLDALVSLHRQIYQWGDAAGSELVIENGVVKRIFGKDTKSGGFTLNGIPYSIAQAAGMQIHPNSSLLFFTGITDGGEEQGIAWLEFAGEQCTELRVSKDRPYTFVVRAADGPIADTPVYLLNSEGQPAGEPLGTSNAAGELTVRFDKVGVQTIAGVNEKYFFSRVSVNVFEPDISIKNISVIGVPAFDRKSELSSGHYAGDLVQTANGTTEGAIGFDPDCEAYRLYTNADTQVINLVPVLNNLEDAARKLLSVKAGDTVLDNAEALQPNSDGYYTLPPITIQNGMSVELRTEFEENGQTFEQTYTIKIIRDTGTMASFDKILEIKGVGTTGIYTIQPADELTALTLLYDANDTTARIDVDVEQGVVLKLNGEAVKEMSEPISVNGRNVVTYRVEFDLKGKEYTLTTEDSNGITAQTLTPIKFARRTNIEGVHAPNGVSDWDVAKGQFTNGNISLTMTGALVPTTSWSKFISLGGFGGYYEVYYEQPIISNPCNPFGIDFLVYGNNFGGAPEPAGVQVSEDGVTWYDLAGQRHYELETYYDQAVLIDGKVVESLLIARSDENGYPGGYPTKVSFGYADVASCSEYPNAEGTYYVNAKAGNPYTSGMAGVLGDGFDLSWAVDKSGRPVELPNGIHYIRMQNVVDVAKNGSFGEVSPEIGTITRINPSSAVREVGITAEPEMLTINGKSFQDFTGKTETNGGRTTYYELDLGGIGSSVDVRVKGAEDDNIYVNMESYYGGTADYIGLVDKNFSRTVRVLVQNGEKEPRIYIIRCTNGGDPDKVANLSSILMTPGDETLELKDGEYVGTVENKIEQIRLTLAALNPAAAICLDGQVIAQNTETASLPLKVGKNVFTVTVTSADGTVIQSYPVVITRKSASETNNTGMIKVSFSMTGDDIHYIMNTEDKYKPGESTGPHNPETWIKKISVEIPKGSTVKYLTDMMLMNSGIEFHTVGGTYIDKIQIPETSQWLGEFDNGPNSGWMYRHNSYIANEGYATRTLNNGDSVGWFYTDDYTKEKNYESGWSNGGSVVPEVSGSEEKIASVKLTVSAAVDGSNTAKVTVDSTKIKRCLEEAAAAAKKAGDGAVPEVNLSVSVGEKATALETTVKTDAIKAIADVSDARLSIESTLGKLTFDNKTLSGFIKKAANNAEIIFGLAKADKESLTGEIPAVIGDSPAFELTASVGTENVHSFDGTVTVTLPYALPANTTAETFTVYYLNDTGKLETMKNVKYDTLRKGYVFATDHFSLFLIKEKSAGAEYFFTDVPETHWAAEYIYYLAERGSLTGKTETTFGPSDEISRAEFVTILAQMSGDKLSAADLSFTDVKAADWYAQYVSWAVRAGITKGTSETAFSPLESITREDMAVMIVKYAEYKSFSLPHDAESVKFTDSDRIASYAAEAMTALQRAGIISGKEIGIAAPKDKATRAEAAKMLASLRQLMENKTTGTGTADGGTVK